jgi:hypothetical protein
MLGRFHLHTITGDRIVPRIISLLAEGSPFLLEDVDPAQPTGQAARTQVSWGYLAA